MKDFNSLQDMYESNEYQSYMADKLGNQLYISDPERAERLQEAAEDGCDGSTHQEQIDDWKEFLDTLRVNDPEIDEPGEGDLTQQQYDKISSEIDDCEAWHDKNGSLFSQRG